MTGVITSLKRVHMVEGVKKGGFGFICDEAGLDRFFHANNVRGVTFDDLLEGQTVEFVPIERKGGKGNGLAAESVTVKVDASAAA